MATKKNVTQAAPLALHHMAAIAPLPSITAVTADEADEQAGILQKARTDVLRLRVAQGRFTFAQQTLHAAAAATERSFVDFVEAEQALLSRVQNPAVQQRIAPFFDRLAEDHANGLLDVRQLLEERVKAIVDSPLDPPAWQEDEYTVEVPNLLTQIFGGEASVKRVRR